MSETQTATEYVVEVYDDGTGEVVHRSKPTYLRRAEKIEDGLSINLNHAAYSTRIVAVPA